MSAVCERAVLPICATPALPDGGTILFYDHTFGQTEGEERDVDLVWETLVTTRAAVEGARGITPIPPWMVTSGTASSWMGWAEWRSRWELRADSTADFAFSPWVGLREHADSRGWTWNRQSVLTAWSQPRRTVVAHYQGQSGAWGFETVEFGPPLTQKPRLFVADPVPRVGGGFLADLPGCVAGAPYFSWVRLDDDTRQLVLVGVVSSHVEVASGGRTLRVITPMGAVGDQATLLCATGKLFGVLTERDRQSSL